MAETIRSSTIPKFFHPPAETVRLKKLQVSLPYFVKQYTEERKACDEMQNINRGEPTVKKWDADLEEWKDLIEYALKFGTDKEVWHAKDAKCSRCEALLVDMELIVCDACKSGKMLPPERY